MGIVPAERYDSAKGYALVKLSLVLLKADGARQEIPITRSPRTIGRDPACDIRVPAASISRRHCEVSFDEDEDSVTIKDLGSSNGTFVNGQKISGETELTPGDTVRIGPFVLVVRMDGFPKEIDAPQALVQAGAIAAAPGRAASGQSQTVVSDEATRMPATRKTTADDSGDFDFDFDLNDSDQKDQPKL